MASLFSIGEEIPCNILGIYYSLDTLKDWPRFDVVSLFEG